MWLSSVAAIQRLDTARAAKRCDGVEHVYLVYRRTKRYMPADEHELVLAVEDGVEFRELLAPEKLENGQLICRVMKLGELDASVVQALLRRMKQWLYLQTA